MKLYYSIHGSDAEEWSLMAYKYYPDKFSSGDTITPYWLKAKIFSTLEDLADELQKMRDMESDSQV